MNEPLFVIVEISGYLDDEWEDRRGGKGIPERRRPTLLHMGDRASAEAEAVRLQAMRPEGRFALFEAVALTRPATAQVPRSVFPGQEEWAIKPGHCWTTTIGILDSWKEAHG